MENLDQDPGWRWSLLSIMKLMIPGYLRFASARTQQDGLRRLRDVWTAFFMAIVLFGVVVALIPQVPVGSATVPVVALCMVAAVSTVGDRAVGRRQLDCATREHLGAAYRSRFFLRMALAEVIALAAFAATFVSGRTWLYYAFAPVTLTAFVRHAPTVSRLEIEQEILRSQGCALSLVGALRAQASPPEPASR